MSLGTYEEVIAHLDKSRRKRHLLLGNGFSMAYDSGIFSYNALNKFIDKTKNPLLVKLFEVVNTKNFELIMQQLAIFSRLAETFSSDKRLKKRIDSASDALKTSLIDAIGELHPEHVFKIPRKRSEACARFINTFLASGGHVFTTNYDILLYWVFMRNQGEMAEAIDGFGRAVEDNGSEDGAESNQIPGDLEWGGNKEGQNVHYLHGALPLFDTGVAIIKEEYTTQSLLLENIKKRISSKEYPVFVTAGNGKEKLTHILHNQYLSFCYEKLSSLDGSLVTFGFNFGDYDEHIIEAINTAARHRSKVPPKLWSIYIGVYSEADRLHIESIKHKFKCKVNMYDARSAPIWASS